MSGAVIEIVRTKDKETETVARAVYEHPLPVRLCHWLNAISLLVMVGSGLQIFRASEDGWAGRSNGTSRSCGSTSRPG